MTSAASRPARIVDAHVHLWDPARADWYPYLSKDQATLDMGDVSGMSRRFDVPAYRTESAGWNVEKLVNVAAATGAHSADETLELDRRADTDGHPDAIIGGLLTTDTIADSVSALDRQSAASRFRGVRAMGTRRSELFAAEVLRALTERELVYEVMIHPDQLVATATGLREHGDLVVVIEHTGAPRNTSDEERMLWQAGIRALAGLGENVFCKLSGLAMPLGTMSVDALTPWIEYVIEAFGADRCLFASNFPVDGLHGSFDDLYTAYSTITAGLSADDRDKLFAANAERVYRC
ncbi:amidohydrolase 2 [Mycolicibacterium rhodesiae JS60]|nr:amidohydrolase 2 [Mycolicibacterium rhodesiae JS60]